MQVQHYRQRLLVPVAWLPQALCVSLYHTVFSREMTWITALQRCEWQHYLDCTRTTQLWCGDWIFLWISSSLLRWPCSFVGKTPVSRTILDGYSVIIVIYLIVDLANGISLMIWLTQLFWGLCILSHLIWWIILKQPDPQIPMPFYWDTQMYPAKTRMWSEKSMIKLPSLSLVRYTFYR